MYIKQNEAHIANRTAQRPRDPAVSLIEHGGEQVYVLTATLTEPGESVGTAYEDKDGNVWLALSAVTKWDIAGLPSSHVSDAAYAEAHAA